MTCFNIYQALAAVAFVFFVGYWSGFTVPKKPTIEGDEDESR